MEKELEIIIDDNELGEASGEDVEKVIENYEESSGESYEK